MLLYIYDGIFKIYLIYVRALSVAKSCLTLCNPLDCSLQAPLSMEMIS